MAVLAAQADLDVVRVRMLVGVAQRLVGDAVDERLLFRRQVGIDRDVELHVDAAVPQRRRDIGEGVVEADAAKVRRVQPDQQPAQVALGLPCGGGAVLQFAGERRPACRAMALSRQASPASACRGPSWSAWASRLRSRSDDSTSRASNADRSRSRCCRRRASHHASGSWASARTASAPPNAGSSASHWRRLLPAIALYRRYSSYSSRWPSGVRTGR